MATITLSDCVRAKLVSLLAEEDSEDAVVRIRETKVGAACKSHMELRLSIDERDDMDEETEIDANGIPFVMSSEVVDIYGTDYDIKMNAENGQPVVTALNQEKPSTPCACSCSKSS